MPRVVAACVDMGYLRSLSRYLDPYPVSVPRCVCVSITHSLTHSSPEEGGTYNVRGIPYISLLRYYPSARGLSRCLTMWRLDFPAWWVRARFVFEPLTISGGAGSLLGG